MGPHARWAAGIACICLVAVIWTLATVLKQIIFRDLHYSEPLILTFVCNACYAVHLPLHALGRGLGLVSAVPWRPQERHRVADGLRARWGATPPACGCRRRPTGELLEEDERRTPVGKEGGAPTAFEAARVGLLIAPLWFAAQWTYSAGVATTTVTSSTVISATSVVWTFLASVVFLEERLSSLKIAGILACLAGNAATQVGDMQAGHPGRVTGNLLCLASAVLYAAYTTTLKRMTSDKTSVVLMFGALGCAVLVLGTPLVLLVRGGALQRLTPRLLGLLLFNGLFDNVLSQYMWAKAVQWTSPIAATVGLSLTIPLSIVADLVRQNPLSMWSFVAATLVVSGFVAVTLASQPAEALRTAPAEEATGGARAATTPLEAGESSGGGAGDLRGSDPSAGYVSHG